MTLATAPRSPDEQQHLVLDGMPWSFYESLLDVTTDRPMRVTFFHGRLEIMPPLAEHEWAKKSVSQLIEVMTLELAISRMAFGSATCRREDQQAGLEPDECYYLGDTSAVRGMKRFDSALHPPPDL